MSLTPLNQSAFETEIARAKKTAVCLFWAGFCKPCRKMTESVINLEKRLGDSAGFFSVNIEENPRIGELAGVLVVPTLIIYKSGRATERLFGLMPEEELAAVIEEVICG